MARKHRAPGDNRTNEQRGYGWLHIKLRRQWVPLVNAGGVRCHAIICIKPNRLITPGSDWHLGHTADRTAWTGPEHAACNLADGARRQRTPATIKARRNRDL